jgi:hypothetical protein
MFFHFILILSATIGITSANTEKVTVFLNGTQLYIAPRAFIDPDPRSAIIKSNGIQIPVIFKDDITDDIRQQILTHYKSLCSSSKGCKILPLPVKSIRVSFKQGIQKTYGLNSEWQDYQSGSIPLKIVIKCLSGTNQCDLAILQQNLTIIPDLLQLDFIMHDNKEDSVPKRIKIHISGNELLNLMATINAGETIMDHVTEKQLKNWVGKISDWVEEKQLKAKGLFLTSKSERARLEQDIQLTLTTKTIQINSSPPEVVFKLNKCAFRYTSIPVINTTVAVTNKNDIGKIPCNLLRSSSVDSK